MVVLVNNVWDCVNKCGILEVVVYKGFELFGVYLVFLVVGLDVIYLIKEICDPFQFGVFGIGVDDFGIGVEVYVGIGGWIGCGKKCRI